MSWHNPIMHHYQRHLLLESMFDLVTLKPTSLSYEKLRYLCYEIEKKLGMSISKIFEIKGEKFFRKIEELTTLKFLKKNKSVISLGGGAFLNSKIKKEILDNHVSFWLNWEVKTLIDRIKNSKKRPLTINATDSDLIDLIKKRTNIYSKALYEIKCDNLTKNEIVDKIHKIYETN